MYKYEVGMIGEGISGLTFTADVTRRGAKTLLVGEGRWRAKTPVSGAKMAN